ncbi:MAG: four helix bundle protein [Gemmatimonadota bacterium]
MGAWEQGSMGWPNQLFQLRLPVIHISRMGKLARSHRDLDVYQWALKGAAIASAVARRLPAFELKMADQIRRCGRSPAVTIAEAWRKRRYRNQWISKLSDAESEAAEAQAWLEIAKNEGYISEEEFEQYYAHFESQVSQLVTMAVHPDRWVSPGKSR